MKVLYYEAKKFLTNKFLVVFLLLLLVCDAALTVYSSNHEKDLASAYIDKAEVRSIYAVPFRQGSVYEGV